VIRSLAARLTLAAQLVALVVIIAFGISSLWVTSHVLEGEREAYVRESARRIAHDFDDELG
jgi:hypothetical protein